MGADTLLAMLSFESRAMLKDRVYGAQETLFQDSYAQCHVVGLPRLLAREVNGTPRCAALRSGLRRHPHQARRDARDPVGGCYPDRVVPTPEGLRFAKRRVIFDNGLIANSLITPIQA